MNKNLPLTYNFHLALLMFFALSFEFYKYLFKIVPNISLASNTYSISDGGS